MTFYGNDPTGVENPDQPNPSQDTKLPESMTIDKVNEITNAESKKTIPIDMKGATVIPKEILWAAKGKDVNVRLYMNGYTWTINGADIKASELEDINLKVTLDTENIPRKTIQALAGTNPIRQISLAHEGDFGFKATLTVNVGNEHAGKYGNLYYHDSDGKMVFINAGKVETSGDVSLDFSHASDYVIVMTDEKISQVDVPESTDGKKTSEGKSPKTGDDAMGIEWLLCAASTLGMSLYLRKKKAR